MGDQILTFYDKAITLIEVVDDQLLSSTQSLKTLVIERNGERMISLQKWWREVDTEPWREGKGFYLNSQDAMKTIDALSRAINLLDM